MTYKSERVRTAALVAHYAAKLQNGDPVEVFRDMVTPQEFADVRAPAEFIRSIARKWLLHHTVSNLSDIRASSRPIKVPDSVIKECAARIKEGYTVQLQVKGPGGQLTNHPVHRYYTSIKQACEMNARLGEVVRQYGVSYAYMRTRLHQVAPELKLRTVEFKYQLSVEQRAVRRVVAYALLMQCLQDPGFLSRVWFVDETSLWIVTTAGQTRQVWADAHDEGVRVVLHTPHLAAHPKNHVRVIGAVNALAGAAWHDFTTGTTAIKRLTEVEGAPYMVSGWYQL
jgi:hypothetical protein